MRLHSGKVFLSVSNAMVQVGKLSLYIPLSHSAPPQLTVDELTKKEAGEMGCKFSCHSSPKFKKHVIRVVHLNGYVEAFENPVPVSQFTGNDHSGKRFLCTPAELVSNCCPKPLQPDTILKPGHVYFLLPFSIFQSDISHLDLASMAKKLNKKARCVPKSSRTSPLLDHYHVSDSGCKSPMRSPNRLSRSEPWKPILDTIREKSFTRRSESELQETADS